MGEERLPGVPQPRGPVRGDDTVRNPHRAQICLFDRFELIICLKLDRQFPVERFEPTVFQSTILSPPLSIIFLFFDVILNELARGPGQDEPPIITLLFIRTPRLYQYYHYYLLLLFSLLLCCIIIFTIIVIIVIIIIIIIIIGPGPGRCPRVRQAAVTQRRRGRS